jgi:hypothetical protein
METRGLSDTRLLAIEIDTLWSTDGRGRLVEERGLNGFPAPHLVVACSSGASVTAVGSEVPDDLALELSGLLAGSETPRPGSPPVTLEVVRRRLEAVMGPVEVASGPSYVAESLPTATSAGTIVPSDTVIRQEPRLRAPQGANWEPGEWRLLLEGALGPWAAVTEGNSTIALCFSARLTDMAAEAGVWTHPDHRGRGHAAAVTAAWGRQVLATGRLVFYSTSASNRSSQRVAARLGLRPIGWIWQLRRPRR